MQMPARFSQRTVAALIGAFVILSFVATPFARGKGGPNVTVDGSVNVADPVTVEGVVEVLNDSLVEPFVVSLSSGNDAVDAPTVYFDIPEGKRLIIETIAYQASLPKGESNRMFIQPLFGTQRQLIPLVIQDRVDAGGYYLIANIPFKMRLDSVEGRSDEVMIRRGTGGLGTLQATICGYLVDK